MQNRARERSVTLATVAVIHVAAVYALVTGLAGSVITRIIPQPFEARNIPINQPRVTPQPPTHADHSPRHTHPVEVNDPLTRDNLGPVIFDRLPTFDPGKPTDDSLTPVPRTPHLPPRGAVPNGQPGLWATANDYPARDLRENHAGTVRFSLSISADGKVGGCIVTGSSGWPGLDAATCRLISARARFTPATNEDGQAMAGSYYGSIRWVIPE